MVAGGLMTAGNPGTAGGLMADQVNAAPSRAADKPMVAALHSVAVAALALSVAASWPFVSVSLSSWQLLWTWLDALQPSAAHQSSGQHAVLLPNADHMTVQPCQQCSEAKPGLHLTLVTLKVYWECCWGCVTYLAPLTACRNPELNCVRKDGFVAT